MGNTGILKLKQSYPVLCPSLQHLGRQGLLVETALGPFLPVEPLPRRKVRIPDMRSKCCVHCFVFPCYHHNQLQVNMAMTVFLIYRHLPWLQFMIYRSDIKRNRMSKLKKKGPNFCRVFPICPKL